MKHLNLSTEFKAVGDTGSFTGHAAIFGNVDLGGDVIERGAFKEIVTNDEGKVVTLWQHGLRDPIGVASVRQDDKGLAFDGQLVLEDATARKAYAHMKAKSVRGMSIGFDILPGGAEVKESGIRVLTALKLWEISVVTFGMNPLAGVDAVKVANQITNEREAEEFLREAGFSKKQARDFVLFGWKGMTAGRREADKGNDLKSCIDLVQSIQIPQVTF